jgi:hypothetical protein
MDLDDVKALWQETDQRLDSMEDALRLQQRLIQAATRERTRSKLWFVRLVLWYEVGFGALAALLAGSYLADSITRIQFAVPATLLHLGAIATLGAAVFQLVVLARIDYSGPVLTIQRELARLRLVRARSNRWLLIAAPLLWALLVVVVPDALVGFDVYRAFGWPWALANLAFGFAVLGAAAILGRRVPDGSRGSAFLRWMGDDLTGRRVAQAAGALDEIAAFEAAA